MSSFYKVLEAMKSEAQATAPAAGQAVTQQPSQAAAAAQQQIASFMQQMPNFQKGMSDPSAVGRHLPNMVQMSQGLLHSLQAWQQEISQQQSTTQQSQQVQQRQQPQQGQHPTTQTPANGPPTTMAQSMA